MALKTKVPAESYVVPLGARGRLVLPAELRQRFGLGEGDRLVVTVEAPGVLRLTSAREVARQARGALREMIGERDLVSELIAERREEGRAIERVSPSAGGWASRC